MPRAEARGSLLTWGASAKPITNCFADLVAQKGYLVFNTGIPGTGPGQYAYLAEKYIPILKPDIVAVILYLGNDIKKPSPMLPNKNLHHVTDELWLYAFDKDGNYLSPEESFYLYYHSEYSPEILKNKLKYLMMSTVIGKKIWLFLRFMKNRGKSNSSLNAVNYVKNLLLKIQEISNQYNAKLFLFIIPGHPRSDDVKIKSRKMILKYFSGLNPAIPGFLTGNDYTELPDGHLNNLGHFKYSRFIIRTISNENYSILK